MNIGNIVKKVLIIILMILFFPMSIPVYFCLKSYSGLLDMYTNGSFDRQKKKLDKNIAVKDSKSESDVLDLQGRTGINQDEILNPKAKVTTEVNPLLNAEEKEPKKNEKGEYIEDPFSEKKSSRYSIFK